MIRSDLYQTPNSLQHKKLDLATYHLAWVSLNFVFPSAIGGGVSASSTISRVLFDATHIRRCKTRANKTSLKSNKAKLKSKRFYVYASFLPSSSLAFLKSHLVS